MNWNEKGLSKIGWQNVYPIFRQLTGVKWDNKKLQNKLGQMRARYCKCVIFRSRLDLAETSSLAPLKQTNRTGKMMMKRAGGHQSMELSSQEESNNSDTSSDGSFYELAGLGAALGAYIAVRKVLFG